MTTCSSIIIGELAGWCVGTIEGAIGRSPAL